MLLIIDDFKMNAHSITLFFIIILSGLLGGIANYYILTDDPKADTPKKNAILSKSLVLGVTASFMVPLFLKTISSQLIDLPTTDGFNKNYFEFAGFCLLAAILSKQFIENLYQKVMKVEAKAERAEAKANAVENELTENEDLEVADTVITPASLNIEDKIINAFKSVKYIFRSSSGITNYLKTEGEEKIEKPEVRELLNKMVNEGKLRTKTNDKGYPLYALKKG